MPRQELPERCFFTGTLAMLIADADALRASMGITGAGGLKSCILCRNLIKRDTLVGRHSMPDGHVHADSLDPAGFQRMTDEMLQEILGRLKALFDSGNTARLQALETLYGVHYIQGGWLQEGGECEGLALQLVFPNLTVSHLPPNHLFARPNPPTQSTPAPQTAPPAQSEPHTPPTR